MPARGPASFEEAVGPEGSLVMPCSACHSFVLVLVLIFLPPPPPPRSALVCTRALRILILLLKPLATKQQRLRAIITLTTRGQPWKPLGHSVGVAEEAIALVAVAAAVAVAVVIVFVIVAVVVVAVS